MTTTEAPRLQEALAQDLHDYGVCRDLKWGEAGHEYPGPCDTLAAHVLTFLLGVRA